MSVELRSGDMRRLPNFVEIGEALPGDGIATKEVLPALRARLSQHAPLGILLRSSML
jgi:hypothetical protein